VAFTLLITTANGSSLATIDSTVKREEYGSQGRNQLCIAYVPLGGDSRELLMCEILLGVLPCDLTQRYKSGLSFCFQQLAASALEGPEG
jgi:hypothetical protein